MSTIVIGKDEKFTNTVTGIRRTCSGIGLANMDIDDQKSVKCIFDTLKDCKWKGTWDQLLTHCQKNHQIKIWSNGEKKINMEIEDLDKDEWRIEIIKAYKNLFCLHIKNDIETGMLYVLAQKIGSNDTQSKFMIRTEFCSPDQLECITNSTLIYPFTQDITKIKERCLCVIKPIETLKRFTNDEGVLKFTVNIY